MQIRVAVTVVLLLGSIVAACGDDEPDPGADPGAPEVVSGVILEIDSEGLGEVNSFRLKDGDDTYTILIDPEREYSFNLGHLHEHLQNADPVVVELEDRDGSLYAITIEDA